MATIANLSINVKAGTADFEGGMGRCERSLKQLESAARRTFVDTQTPLENYTYKLAQLNKMYQRGLVDVTTYGRAVRKLNDDMNAKMNDGASQGGLADTFGKAGAAAIRVGTTMMGIRASVEAANIGMDLFSGNIEKADEAARRLPLGIGGLYSAMFEGAVKIVDMFDKVGASADKWTKQQSEVEAETKRIMAEQKMIQDAQERAARTRKELAEDELKVKREIEAVGLKGAEKSRFDERNRHEDRLKQIDGLQKEHRLTGGADYMRTQEELLHNAKMRQIAEEETADAMEKQKRESEQLAKERERAYRESAAGRTEDLIAGLTRDRNLFGLEGRDRQIEELRQGGAPQDLLDKASALDAELDSRERQNRLIEEGKALIEEMLTPQERYNKALDKLNDLWDAGAIDADAYARAMEKEDKALADANQPITGEDSLARSGGMSSDYAAGLVDMRALTGQENPTVSRLDKLINHNGKTNEYLRRIAEERGLR